MITSELSGSAAVVFLAKNRSGIIPATAGQIAWVQVHWEWDSILAERWSLQLLSGGTYGEELNFILGAIQGRIGYCCLVKGYRLGPEIFGSLAQRVPVIDEPGACDKTSGDL